MSAAAAVARLKRALVIFRHAAQPTVAGAGVAIEVEGRAVIATDAAVADLVEFGGARALEGDADQVLVRDDESHVGLIALRGGSMVEPIGHLVTAPLADTEDLLVVGPGVTVRTGHHARHAWITHAAIVAGRIHDVAAGERLETFAYAISLAPGALPAGSPVVRRDDGALVALLGAESPAPGIVIARPVREIVGLMSRLKRAT